MRLIVTKEGKLTGRIRFELRTSFFGLVKRIVAQVEHEVLECSISGETAVMAPSWRDVKVEDIGHINALNDFAYQQKENK